MPETPYTDDYNTLLDIAQEEQSSGACPVISGTIEDFEDYDVVYLGFLNWWDNMPMILYTFFDEYDLSGKTIVPFCTSGGSGFSNTISEIESMEPEATVLEGLHIGDSDITGAEKNVTEWLDTNGLTN